AILESGEQVATDPGDVIRLGQRLGVPSTGSGPLVGVMQALARKDLGRLVRHPRRLRTGRRGETGHGEQDGRHGADGRGCPGYVPGDTEPSEPWHGPRPLPLRW